MIYIVAFIALIAIGGWLVALFDKAALTAYLALKKVPMPTEEEWKKCAKAAWRWLLKRK